MTDVAALNVLVQQGKTKVQNLEQQKTTKEGELTGLESTSSTAQATLESNQNALSETNTALSNFQVPDVIDEPDRSSFVSVDEETGKEVFDSSGYDAANRAYEESVRAHEEALRQKAELEAKQLTQSQAVDSSQSECTNLQQGIQTTTGEIQTISDEINVSMNDIQNWESQIARAEADEQSASKGDVKPDEFETNLEAINNLGEQISAEGGAVVTKQFAANTTADQIAETQVSRYLDTMLNSDMFTSEEKTAFKEQLSNALQNPKSRKALKNGDMATVLKDPAVRELINDKTNKINVLNLNNPDAFKTGKVDVPLTSGEYDLGERKQEYTDFMYMMLHAADANTEYFKAGLKENSGMTDMYAPVLRGFNNEIVNDLETSNKNMHNAMSDIVLKQDASRFISALNQVNGNNFGVSKDDIAQLFQDYSSNPEDPSIKTRLLKYCGFEASANRLNNDLSTAQGAKRVCDFMVTAITLKTPGVGLGEGVGLGAKGLFNLATKGSTSVKLLNFSKNLGNTYIKIGKGLDHLNTANSFYDLFRSICPSGK